MFVELAHQSALLPVVAVLLWRPSWPWSLLALAWAVSWIADSMAWATGGSWAALYVWVPVQVGLVLLAVADEWDRAKVLALVVFAGVVSALVSYPDPEVLVIALGSAAIVMLAKGRLRWPLYLYFGSGTVLYLMMVSGEFMTYWYGYQASRLGAFAVFVALVAKGHHGRDPD